MAIELKVPSVGESISEVTIGEWLKSEGEWVEKDEPVVALETDKASLEVPAPQAGKLQKQIKRQGDSAGIGEVIALIEAGAEPGTGTRPISVPPGTLSSEDPTRLMRARPQDGQPAGQPERKRQDEPRVMPAAKRMLAEHGLRADQVQPSGPGGRVLKEDVQRAVEAGAPQRREAAPAGPAGWGLAPGGARGEQVVPMTPLRKRIAERLVQSQQGTATLTTFNEIDMSAVIALRKQWQESFQSRYGIKLGFMSFFVKAAIEALKQYPEVNAEIRGTDVVYHDYYDIGVAVGGGKGLVVPVIRNAERLSFAQVEQTIADFAERARQNKLSLEELQGGTFTISNGGVYGSLLATPIINPPQSAILGMHAIQERPVVRDGQVVARPMMYVALSYDHRLIDGRESVGFLKRIKECVEDPERILLEV